MKYKRLACSNLSGRVVHVSRQTEVVPIWPPKNCVKGVRRSSLSPIAHNSQFVGVTDEARLTADERTRLHPTRSLGARIDRIPAVGCLGEHGPVGGAV